MKVLCPRSTGSVNQQLLFDKNRSFLSNFCTQKFADSKGSTFGRLPQKAKVFIVQALIGKAREPFCKRKGSRKPIESRVQPQKLSGGWFLTAETYIWIHDIFYSEWFSVKISLSMTDIAQTAEKSPTGRFFWKVRVVFLSRGLFSCKSPLFYNPNLGL